MLLDALFPPICLACTRLLRSPYPSPDSLELCTTCRLEVVPLESDPVASFAYEGPLADALHRLKYGGRPGYAGPLGRAFAAQNRLAHLELDVVLPVPLHRWRRITRGFNQVELILRHALAFTPDPPRWARDLLVRTRHTPPQARLPASERTHNVRDAFAVRRPERVRGRRIGVFDDVVTTGATLAACSEALKQAEAAAVVPLALLRAAS